MINQIIIVTSLNQKINLKKKIILNFHQYLQQIHLLPNLKELIRV